MSPLFERRRSAVERHGGASGESVAGSVPSDLTFVEDASLAARPLDSTGRVALEPLKHARDNTAKTLDDALE
jgi:hypothetical protein